MKFKTRSNTREEENRRGKGGEIGTTQDSPTIKLGDKQDNPRKPPGEVFVKRHIESWWQEDQIYLITKHKPYGFTQKNI